MKWNFIKYVFSGARLLFSIPFTLAPLVIVYFIIKDGLQSFYSLGGFLSLVAIIIGMNVIMYAIYHSQYQNKLKEKK